MPATRIPSVGAGTQAGRVRASGARPEGCKDGHGRSPAATSSMAEAAGDRQGSSTGIARGGSGISPIANTRRARKLPTMRSDGHGNGTCSHGAG
jgi:hypothetical protein